MEKWRKLILILTLGLFSACILLLSTKDIHWFLDEIFAIMVSILFFSPVVNSLIEGRPPKEWIVVFVIGGVFSAIYLITNFGKPVEVIEFFFIILLITAISTIGNLITNKLMDVIPPK